MNINVNTSRRSFLTTAGALMIPPVVLDSCQTSAHPTSTSCGSGPIGGVPDGAMSSLLTNGFASLCDLSDSECRKVLEQLTAFEKTFLDTGPHDPTYPWPRDALHWWSRIWEYPYAWINLHPLITRDRSGMTPILDFGSGVTAFPFFVAKRLDVDVICTDIDASLADSIARTARKLSIAEHISFLHNAEYSLPLNTAAIGCVYCISVFEHISEPDRIIAEFDRVLKPRGVLIVTMDVAARFKGGGIGAATYRKLHESLRRYFEPLHDRRPVHPTETLTSENSPLPLRASVPFSVKVKDWLRLPWGTRPWWDDLLIVEGFVGRKRS
jgi:SAM-dependent methyltransferase